MRPNLKRTITWYVNYSVREHIHVAVCYKVSSEVTNLVADITNFYEIDNLGLIIRRAYRG